MKGPASRAPLELRIRLLLAARRRRSEARERVEVAHQRVATYVRRRRLRRLRDVVWCSAHEPRKEDLVLRVVVPVGTLTSVGVWPLPERVRALGEADPDHRVTRLEDVRAAVL